MKQSMAQQNWRAKQIKKEGKGKSEKTPKEKRERLGNSKQRSIYCHAKAPKFNEYPMLCERADKLNGA